MKMSLLNPFSPDWALGSCEGLSSWGGAAREEAKGEAGDLRNEASCAAEPKTPPGAPLPQLPSLVPGFPPVPAEKETVWRGPQLPAERGGTATPETGSPNRSPSPRQRRVVPAELKRDLSIWAGFQDNTGRWHPASAPAPAPTSRVTEGEEPVSLGPERREYTFSSPLADGNVGDDSRG